MTEYIICIDTDGTMSTSSVYEDETLASVYHRLWDAVLAEMDINSQYALYGALTEPVKRTNSIVSSIAVVVGHAKTVFDKFSQLVKPYVGTSRESLRIVDDTEIFLPIPFKNLTRWNSLCLQALTAAEVDGIPKAFCQVKSLVFVLAGSSSGDILCFYRLLIQPKFVSNIDTLWILEDQKKRSAARIFTAINHMPKLTHLLLNFRMLDFNSLPVLRKLKTFYVSVKNKCVSEVIKTIDLFASKDDQLKQVIDIGNIANEFDALLRIDPTSKDSIIRISNSPITNIPLSLVTNICSQLKHIRSLAITVEPSDYRELISVIASLPKLAHLYLSIDFTSRKRLFDGSFKCDEIILPCPDTPLLPVTNAELNLTICDHGQIQWLNLTNILPNCSSLYIERFRCGHCGSDTAIAGRNFSPVAMMHTSTSQCIREFLCCVHTGLSSSHRVILYENRLFSLESVI